MGDQEWERARGDHQRGRRYHQEHESEAYVLARQQLERNANTRGAPAPAVSEGPLSGIRGVAVLIVILVVGWQIYGAFAVRDPKKTMSTYDANVATIRAGTLYKAATGKGQADSVALLQVTARLVDYFSSEPTGVSINDTVSGACGRRLKVCDPLIGDYREVAGAAAVRAAELYALECNRPRPLARCADAPDELKALKDGT